MAQSTAPHAGARRNSWATGGSVFAGVLLLVDGVISIFKGIAGIVEDDVYARIGDYILKFNVSAWGWILLILGLILLCTGLGILKGAAWARGVGVGLAALSIVINFLWLPYAPVWAIISIAIDVFVIWALCSDHPSRTTA